jgi:hypothetical protein
MFHQNFPGQLPSFQSGNVPSLGEIWPTNANYGEWELDPVFVTQLETASPGIVSEAQANSWDLNSFFANLSQLIGVGVQAKAQHDLLQANIDRAKQGLPPLTAQNYMPGVNVGVTSDTQKLILGVVGITAAALIIPPLFKKGRR